MPTLIKTHQNTEYGSGAKLINPRIDPRSSDPSSPNAGQMWIDTTSNLEEVRFYTGSKVAPLLRTDTAKTITGLLTFNPSSGTVPFAVDASKNGVVANLNAALLNGRAWSESADNSTVVSRTSTGTIVGSTPTQDGELATKAYVDAAMSGNDDKDSVRAATTSALASFTFSANVLTADSNGALPDQGGVTLVLNDRLLVKNESGSDEKYNGLYFVSQVGDGSNPWKLTRTTDADADAEVTSGLRTYVEEGTNSGGIFSIITTGTITLNTTAIAFAQTGGATLYSAGNGLVKDGSTFHFGTSGTYSNGAIPYASSGSAISMLSPAATGNVLLSGTTPSWGKVSLSTHISGTLPIANGGTNSGAGLNNGRLMVSSGSAIVERAALDVNCLLVGNASTGVGSLAKGTANQLLGMDAAGTTYEHKSFAITSAGVVTSGTWNGGTLGVAYGGTGTGTAFSNGSIVFAGASGIYSESVSDLHWDNSNKRFGIGTNSPDHAAHLHETDTSTTMVDGRGWLLENSSDATVSNTYLSPPLIFRSEGWTSGTSQSRPVEFMLYSKAVAGSSNPTGNLHIQAAINDGSFSDIFTLSSSGVITNATWQGASIDGTYLGSIPASKVTTGTFGSGDFELQGGLGIGTSPSNASLEVLKTAEGEGLRVDGASGGFSLITRGGTSRVTSLRHITVGSGFSSNTPPTNGALIEGNVGIGVASPNEKFVVDAGSGSSGLIARFQATTAQDNEVRGVRFNAKNLAGDTSYFDIAIDPTNERAGFGFKNSGSGLPLGEATLANAFMTFDASGNVAIGAGATVPGARLEVKHTAGDTLRLDKASGASINFYKAGTAGPYIGHNGSDIRFGVGGSARFRMSQSALLGETDKGYNLGSASNRWGTAYTGVVDGGDAGVTYEADTQHSFTIGGTEAFKIDSNRDAHFKSDKSVYFEGIARFTRGTNLGNIYGSGSSFIIETSSGDIFFKPGNAESIRFVDGGAINIPGLTASQYVKTDSSKNLTTVGNIPSADVSEGTLSGSFAFDSLLTLTGGFSAAADSTLTANLLIDNAKQLRLGEADGNGTNYVALQAPTNVGENATWILPSTDVSNGVWQSDGTGSVSCVSEIRLEKIGINQAAGTEVLEVNGNTRILGHGYLDDELRFYDADRSHYVGFKSPASLSASTIFDLPSDTDSGFIYHNGSQVLSFEEISATYLPSDVCRMKEFTIGDGTQTEITCTHNFGTKLVAVEVIEGDDTILAGVTRSSTNAVQISFNKAPSTNSMTVLVIAKNV